MRRIMLRELKFLSKNYRGFGGVIVAMCAILTPLVNGGSVFGFFTLFGGIAGIAATEMESRDKAYYSILSSPCTRTDYVLGKFLSNIIWILLIAFIGGFLHLGIQWVIPGKVSEFTFGMAKLIVGYIFVCVSIYLVLYFTLGVKYAKVGYFLCFFAIMMGVMMMDTIFFSSSAPKVATTVYNFLQSSALINNLIYFVIIGGIVGLLAYVSAIAYNKKDL